jgi:hypothetical protein
VVALFALTSFLTAALLFLVQPLVARMVLPAFGGSPQVWTTSMLFFQLALLAGYGATHLATTRLSRRTQPAWHVAFLLLPVALLPIALDVAPSGRGGLAPALELLAALIVGVALPFVLVATSGPLVQRWFSWTDHPRASDPYFLYAAGNLGSAVGLLAYPFVLEPLLDVPDQAQLWAGGYGLAVVLLACCAVATRHRRAADDRDAAGPEPRSQVSPPQPQQHLDRPPRSRVGRWVLLAFVPSSLMLAATSHLSTDVAAVPLLWILPLGIYLLTFSVAFSSRGLVATRVASWLAPAVVVAAIAIGPDHLGVPAAIAIQVLLVLVGGLVAHGQLAADRPPPSQLTRFYLWVAVGGALGGLVNGLVAPWLFPTVLEHGAIAAGTLALVVRWRELVVGTAEWHRIPRLAAAALVALVPVAVVVAAVQWYLPDPVWLRVAVFALLLAPLLTPVGRSGVVAVAVVLVAAIPHVVTIAAAEEVDRTFFGVHRVEVDGQIASLLHGTTLHGTQDRTSLASRLQPTTYYDPDGPFGPIGEALVAHGDTGVVGLGSGAIAAYGGAGDRLVFHEIDPAVVRLARTHFTYLRDSDADVEVVLGDGRLTLDGVDPPYRTLLVDAFSSDAIPVHLLTREALETYLEATTDDGAIGLHVTNRHLDLLPVAAAHARALDLHAAVGAGTGGGYRSVWVVLARDAAVLEPLREAGFTDLRDEVAPTDEVSWTDRRSDLLRVLR